MWESILRVLNQGEKNRIFPSQEILAWCASWSRGSGSVCLLALLKETWWPTAREAEMHEFLWPNGEAGPKEIGMLVQIVYDPFTSPLTLFPERDRKDVPFTRHWEIHCWGKCHHLSKALSWLFRVYQGCCRELLGLNRLPHIRQDSRCQRSVVAQPLGEARPSQWKACWLSPFSGTVWDSELSAHQISLAETSQSWALAPK